MASSRRPSSDGHPRDPVGPAAGTALPSHGALRGTVDPLLTLLLDPDRTSVNIVAGLGSARRRATERNET